MGKELKLKRTYPGKMETRPDVAARAYLVVIAKNHLAVESAHSNYAL